eukprot:753378-Hanusia_phi.AAC.4
MGEMRACHVSAPQGWVVVALKALVSSCTSHLLHPNARFFDRCKDARFESGPWRHGPGLGGELCEEHGGPVKSAEIFYKKVRLEIVCIAVHGCSCLDSPLASMIQCDP